MEYYNAKDLQRILKISQGAAYELMQRKDFPVIKLGRSKRVKDSDLFEWLEKQKEVVQ